MCGFSIISCFDLCNPGCDALVLHLGLAPAPGMASGPLPATDLSLDTERSNVRVAYQGSPGTVMEAMVLKAFPECIAVPYKKIEGAFQGLAQREHSLSDLGVTKKNVDHGAAGAEIVSMQNLRDAGVIGVLERWNCMGLTN